ncbi:bifunctional 2-polyprenyl-6-hydroxyphenol methylase/3-demethylubiquinol 3-O-methyltransferase UbiG [Calothrix sp. PCC 7507]|uniref:class I SAM-dependent methyltransferase n=1 Tax=Calothrix sp. PCC 7507 TaxID=99598 RepID=UPI00029F4DDF|nr:methyltransferase domain-containing protein [Calothrix sp. PCC 7507]AFY35248.1 Methyltransferase type 12 [Calothrix sp. PCC 7507]
MATFPTPPFLDQYLQDSFILKAHLQEFLHLDSETLETKLEAQHREIADLGHKDFDWEQATAFYSDKVGDLYLFELGAWHLASRDYIGDTLRLIADHAQGRVLDFGGGIGTHTIGAALCPQVEQVIYCDINPINRDFVQYRAEQMGLSKKILFCLEVPPNETFETILAFDVLEHLPNPSQKLLNFYEMLKPEGKMILNWYFFKGFNQEYPIHLDDPQVIETFFRKLQSNFLEVFHPYHITARCYRKWN